MPRLRENVTTNDLCRSYRFWGGPIAFQGNWQDPTFHGHPTLNYNYGSFDGCSYIVYMYAHTHTSYIIAFVFLLLAGCSTVVCPGLLLPWLYVFFSAFALCLWLLRFCSIYSASFCVARRLLFPRLSLCCSMFHSCSRFRDWGSPFIKRSFPSGPTFLRLNLQQSQAHQKQPQP